MGSFYCLILWNHIGFKTFKKQFYSTWLECTGSERMISEAGKVNKK